MPALSAPDRALWITHSYRYSGYLWLDRPPIVFQARVNQGLWTTNPDAQIPFDTVTTGAYTDVLPGLTFLLGSSAGADDLGRGRIRKAATSTIMYIGESSRGDHDGEITASDNDYITVLDDRRIWAVHPRYILENGVATAYKDYDITVVTGGRNYASRPGPKANGGCDRAGLVASGTNLSTFTFSDESLYITSGSSFASRLWDVGDGTITVGSTTSASITATFPIGRRYITLTVTDDNGDSDTHYILVVSLSLDHATYKPIQQFEIIEDRETELGKSMAFVIREDIPYGTYYDGVEAIYFEVETYGTTTGSLAGPDTAEGVKFVGWLDIERESPEATFQGVTRDAEIRCISTAEKMRHIVLLPQLLKYKSSPDEWDEASVVDTTRLAWYLMRWHSTVLSRVNFLLPSGFDQALKRWATTAGDLWGQLAETAKARAFRFTCDKRGILRMVGDVQIQASADRTSTVITTIGADDYERYEWERRRNPALHWIDGSAITVGTTKALIAALFAVSPGDAPGQGAQRSTFASLIVEDQAQLNDWTGNEYARLNSPWTALKLSLAHTGDAGIDPALMEWITLTVPSTSNRRGRALTTQRCLPLEINISHSNDEIRSKNVEITCWIEVTGYPAATRTVQASGAGVAEVVPGPSIYPIITTEPAEGSVAFGDSPAVYALPSAGDCIVRTRTQTGSPTWEVVFDLTDLPSALDIITHFVLDGWNPKNAAYVVGITGVGGAGNVKLYYVENLNAAAGGQTITELTSIANLGALAGISTSINLQGAIYGHYTNSGGNNALFRRSSYAGSFSTAVIGGTPVFEKGVALGHHAASATSGRLCAPGTDDDLYESTNMGGSFSVIRNGPASGGWTCAHYPYNNNSNDMILYAGYSTATTPMTIANLQRRNADGTWSSIAPYNASAASDWRYARFTEDENSFLKIHTYTENRNILAVSGSHSGLGGFLYLSSDGGDTWDTPISVPNAIGDGASGIGGWPYDPDILFLFGYNQEPITGGSYGIWWTDDRGVTWNDMLGDWATSIGVFTGIRNLVPVAVP